jgi:formate hydrogenlyase subunit 3/multisubunit Na+/H+ antiporter MnhD subunit
MIIIVILTLPLLLALGGLYPRLRSMVISYAPWSALPALVLALWNPPHTALEVSWLFIGIRLGLDDVGQSFMIVTALLWTLAGVSARASFIAGSNSHRLFFVYLVTLTGILGLFMAQDLPTFTLFYALMTFAAYALIIVDNTTAAKRAGRIYLILAVAGEALLLEAVLLITSISGNQDISQIPAAVAVGAAPERNLIIGLLLAGFGIKMGLFPLHAWIPLAYTATPTAIGAVLSGSMLMAGFLGWIRFLPLGGEVMPEWGLACIIAGIVTLLYGVVVGLTQHNPRTILAYSTISQAGLMTTGIGMGMIMPDLWLRIDHLVLLYALHLALVMGGLFLGVGVARKATGPVWQYRLVAFGLTMPALALAGAPFSSGTLVNAIFEAAAPMTPWTAPLRWVPSLGAIGTTLLMGRFLIEAWPRIQGKGTQPVGRLPMGTWLPWAVLLVCGGLLAWIVRLQLTADAGNPLFSPISIWTSVWPILLGGLFVWGVTRKSDRIPVPSIPPGDLVVGIEWLGHRTKEHWDGIKGEAWQTWRSGLASHTLLHKSRSWTSSTLEEMEGRLGQWITLGAAFLFLAAILFTLLLAT